LKDWRLFLTRYGFKIGPAPPGCFSLLFDSLLVWFVLF
jgi:hypothetical protein